MGDRTTTFYKCNCGGEIEEYDAPSSLMFTASCNKCDFRDPREYYEISSTEITLSTPEEARNNGGLVTCQKCKKEVMGSYILEDGCIDCPAIEDIK